MRSLTLTRLALLSTLLVSPVAAQPQPLTLRVYGAGGPLAPMQEAAQRYGERTGVRVVVVGGPRAEWLEQARQDADVMYEGAEYALRSFASNEPALVDLASRVTIADRGAAILVRKGNPKGIRTFRDLARPGLKLLDVNGAGQVGLWEDLAGRYGVTAGVSANIPGSFANTALAIAAWKADPSYDAWITYASWGPRLPGDVDVVNIPAGMNVYRGTPAALARTTKNHAAAAAFLTYLQTAEARAIFRKWGWR